LWFTGVNSCKCFNFLDLTGSFWQTDKAMLAGIKDILIITTSEDRQELKIACVEVSPD